ncbi:ArgK protein [Umbelopsis sp. AD052]|nr:ArgK protein [Umbelopsis sp. AD052]
MLSRRLWHSMPANASRPLIYQGARHAIASNNASTTDRFSSFAPAYPHSKNTKIQAPLIAAYSTVASSKTLKLSEQLAQGSRYALAKSITLVESSRSDHRAQAQQLLSYILKKQRDQPLTKPTFRIGLSGSPGVGKSTFIEAFGMYLLEQGHKVAVLAVDPSSSRTGGSILGDKTRMTELSRADDAYVRPSPSRGTLGGVARNTNEAILLCEAAGYDVTLVETVGVGQSETMVAEMVDMFVLLVGPGGGDELQGLKKGIVELSDLVVVNKADGKLADAARAVSMDYTSAIKFLQPPSPLWKTKVLRVSSRENTGIDKAWEAMKSYFDTMTSANKLTEKRGAQRKVWMWRQITSELVDRLNSDDKVKQHVAELESKVFDGKMTSGQAADSVVDVFLNKVKEDRI